MIKPIQISADVAADIASTIQSSDGDAKHHRTESLRELEQRRRAIVSKLDRGYEDLIEGKISNDFWARKSKAWEAELGVVDGEKTRMEAPRTETLVTAQKILELAKKAETLYKSWNPADQRLFAGNGAIELHLR